MLAGLGGGGGYCRISRSSAQTKCNQDKRTVNDLRIFRSFVCIAQQSKDSRKVFFSPLAIVAVGPFPLQSVWSLSCDHELIMQINVKTTTTTPPTPPSSACQIIGPIRSSQASLIETISNGFFGLPLVTPSASAARAITYFASGTRGLGAGPSFLLGTQPDVFEHMKALARLILDMKTERDYARGW